MQKSSQPQSSNEFVVNVADSKDNTAANPYNFSENEKDRIKQKNQALISQFQQRSASNSTIHASYSSMNNMVANAATGTTAQAPLNSHEHLLETFDSSLEAALGVGDRSKQKAAVATQIGGNNRKNSLESSGTLYSQTPLRIRPPQNRLNKSQAVSVINASATNT